MNKNSTAPQDFDILTVIPERLSKPNPVVPIRLEYFAPPVNEILYPLDLESNKILKRGFDIFFSFTVIVLLLSWLLPVLALLIKLSSRGPVFFKQLRTGLNNKPFTCWKLRSMQVLRSNGDVMLDSERVTWVGRFLRKFSLDEMPQFFNVFLGHMSVIGPRPHMLVHTEAFSRQVDNFMLRHRIRPGITGLSQVRGYRGEIKCPKTLRTRVRLDLLYLRKWSFLLDLEIVVKTARLVIFGDRNAF
jgi:lipopolysaccharide/colanic/teichoic acid biosynthesis glycosyltransferase